MFTAEDISTILDKGTSSYPSITDIDVTLDGMRNLLLKFDLNKSTGPNNIHAAFLNHTAFKIAPLLIHLFQQSLRNGIVPVFWKQANITLIYKKGDKTDPGYYHIVSLTSLGCKALEHTYPIVCQIMKHLEMNEILAKVQYGLRSNHSYEANYK